LQGNRVITGSLVMIVVFIAGVLLRLAKPVLFPFFLAVFLSFILAPLLNLSSRLKIPRSIAILFILVITFFILYLLGALFYSSGKAFAAEIPTYSQKVNTIVTDLQEKFELSRLKWEPVDWLKQLDLGRAGGLILDSLGPFLSFLSNLFLILIFLIFILAGKGQVKAKIEKAFDPQRAQTVSEIFVNIDRQVQKYLAIKTVVSFFTGVFVWIVLLVFGVDYAIIFGFLTFLLNYIPNIGSIIATAFPVIIAVFQFETVWPAVWILVILITIQMLMGNLVEPRLMGEGLGLSPLVVLFFLFFWGWLWGIPGMILAVPIAAVVKIVCSNIPEFRFISVFMSKGIES